MTTPNDFLPENYETPASANQYMKFQDGENRFRVLSKPILGWIDWDGKKPIRYRFNDKPAKSIDPLKPIKHFWSMVVWNVAEEKVQILEITQSTVQAAIQSLSKDDDWGSPFDYDLKVTKTGKDMDTKYGTNPAPKKPITAEIQQAIMDKGPINLEALFEGGDPFAKSDLPF